MNNLKKSELIIRLCIVVAGLGLWVVGTAIHEKFVLGLNVGEVLSHLGFLVFVFVLMHWVYEWRLKKEMFDEIISTTTGSVRLAESGITDYVKNSKKIDYSVKINKSKNISICVHYSPRFLEDYSVDLKRKTASTEEITVYALKEDCDSLDYLIKTRHESDHIKPNMRKIRALVKDLSNSGVNIKLIEHDSILRYSFVMFDDLIWVKLYKNAVGLAEIPAVAIRSGTELHKFFSDDISDLSRSMV